MRSLIGSSSPTLGFSTALKEVAFPKPTARTIRMTFRHHKMVGKAGLGLEWGEMKNSQENYRGNFVKFAAPQVQRKKHLLIPLPS